MNARGRSSIAQGVIGIKPEGADCTPHQGEEFRATVEPRTVAKYLSDGRDLVARERGLKVATLVVRRGLCAFVVPLEVWIRNDAPTFNTSDFAGFVFRFRDGVGDQTIVGTGAGCVLSGSLRCVFLFH